MKIEKEFLEDHQIKLRVEFEPEQFESAKRRAARQIAKRVKIPGFRPGKAPYKVVVRHVGEGAIIEDAIERFIDEMYPKVLEEADIEPYGPGELDKMEKLEPPTFVFKVPLDPEVELGDYKALKIPYEPPEVPEAKIDAELEAMRHELALAETSTEPAQEGDEVYFQVSAERVEPKEGEDATIFEARFNSLIAVADETEEEWPFAGFSSHLIGMSAGESKDILYTYPDDYDEEDLRGVEAVFHVQVTNVQKVILPDLDDEFAKSASEFDTLEELRADIRERLENEALDAYDMEYSNQVLDTLVEQSAIKYPPQMLESEIKNMVSNLEYRLAQQGLSMELYKQIRHINDEDIVEETRPYAEARVKRNLVLAQVYKTEKIAVDEDELETQTGYALQAVVSGMSKKELRELQKSDYVPNLISNIYADLAASQTMRYLRALAKGDIVPQAEEAETHEDRAPEAEEDAPEAAEGDTAPETEPAPENSAADPEPEALPEPPANQPAPEAASSGEEAA